MSAEYLQFRIADFLSRILPRRLTYWVSNCVSDHFYRHDVKGRLAVISNLRRIYHFRGLRQSEETLERLARLTFTNFGKYVADFFRFTGLTKEQLVRIAGIEHPEYIEEAAGQGKGVLAVTAHLGNWEIGGAALAAMGYPMNVVVLPHRNTKTNDLFQSRREKRGLKVIPLGRAARGILEALRKKEFAALLADRDYSAHSCTVNFFGAPARLPSGTAELSVMTGAPVLPDFNLRQEDDTFLVRMHPPVKPQGMSAGDMQERICRVMEKEIGERPEQWFIFDDFWRNGPVSGTARAGAGRRSRSDRADRS